MKWRGRSLAGYLVDIDGNHLCEYFPTEEEAQAFVDEQHEIKNKLLANGKTARRWHKKSDAKYADLPVGLSQAIQRKIQNGNAYEYNQISTIVTHKGVSIETYRVQFGVKYSRDQAIDMVMARRQRALALAYKYNDYAPLTIRYLVRFDRCKNITELSDSAYNAILKMPEYEEHISVAYEVARAKLI